MEFDLIIENGILADGFSLYEAAIGIKDGKITAISKSLAQTTQKTIDARGKYVIPGGIDVHVHFQLPFCATISADDFVTGTKAAAAGGVTTIIDFAIQQKGKSLMDAIRARREEADGKVCVDYSLHGAITDWNDATKAELPKIIDYGIPSFKMFMIYRTEGWMADDGMLFEALELSAKLGAMIEVHAESAFILEKLIARYHTPDLMKKYGAYCHALSRPNYIEEEAIQRAVKWAEVTDGRLYIVHMSTGGGAAIVGAAKTRGVNVHAETCPQYLLLTDDMFRRDDGHLYATCPQLKSSEDCRSLWNGLARGEIEVVATDTCTFTREQKAMWNGDFTKIPYGLPGVETLLPLMYSEGVTKGRLNLNKFIELISVNPAKLFGMYPAKGSLQVGTDADLVIIDPKHEVKLDPAKLETNCDWSPYDGWLLHGYPVLTICRGEIVADTGTFVGTTGYGKFIARKPCKGYNEK
jgi:dihydropyrimidinase